MSTTAPDLFFSPRAAGETESSGSVGSVALKDFGADPEATPKLITGDRAFGDPNVENELGRDGRAPYYGNKSRFLQMWVEEDSKISLTGRLRDPNSLTPAATQDTADLRDPMPAAEGVVARVQVACESALSNTCDMLTDLQSGTLRKVDDAVDLLDRVEVAARRGLEERREEANRLTSENKYLQGELVEARAALDRIYHSVFRSRDPNENATSNSVVLKVVKRVRQLEQSKKASGEEAKRRQAESSAATAREEELRAELRTLKGSELKLRGAVSALKSKNDSYKRTIKELDADKARLEEGLRALEGEKADEADEVAALKARAGEGERKLEQMQSFLRAAQRKKAVAERALEGAEEQIQGLSAKVLDQAARLSEFAREKEETEAERDGLRAEVEAFARNEERTRQELRQASDESTAKHYRVHELRTALAELSARHETKEMECAELQEEKVRLEVELGESRAREGELGRRVADLSLESKALASALPKQVEAATSSVSILHADLERRMGQREAELSKVCARFQGVLNQHREKVESLDSFHAVVEAKLAGCLERLRQGDGEASISCASGQDKILRQIKALAEALAVHVSKHDELRETSQCLEVNMVQAQDELEGLKCSVRNHQKDKKESESENLALAAERDALQGRVSALESVVETAKEAIHKRSCEPLCPAEGEGSQDASTGELFVALKMLLEELRKGSWDVQCLQQDLTSKEELISRLEYKAASYTAALQTKAEKLESMSQLSETRVRDSQTKQKELLEFNEQLYAKLECKEGLLEEFKGRLDCVAREARENAEKLEEMGQSTEVQLYKISSSFRCLDDVEANILESFESLRESLELKEKQLDSIVQDLERHSGAEVELERAHAAATREVAEARAREDSWRAKYSGTVKAVERYLPRVRAKIKEHERAKLMARVTRKRNVRLTRQVRILKSVQARGLVQVRDEIHRVVKGDVLAQNSRRSAALAGRAWRLAYTSRKKIDGLQALLETEAKEKRGALDRLDGAVKENKSLKASMGKQAEMLTHLCELESFLQRSKETISDLQASNREKEVAIKELKGAKSATQEEKLGIQERARLLEGQLLKTQEELVVTQNQCAVTAKEHLRLIENYAQLQSASRSYEEDARAVQEKLDLERSANADQREQNESMKGELVAKEHRLRELRCALSSVCSERDEAAANLQLSAPPGTSCPAEPLAVTSEATQTDDNRAASSSVALQTEKGDENLEAQADILLLRSEMEAVKGALRVARTSDAHKQRRLASLQDEVRNLEGELRAKEASLGQLQGILDNALEALAESTQEMMEISAEPTEAQKIESASANQLKAVEIVIATWRQACQKRDLTIESLRSKLETFSEQLVEVEKEAEGRTERETSLLKQKLKESYAEVKCLARDLEDHRRRLASAHGSSQKSLRILREALGDRKGHGSRGDNLEAAASGAASLVRELREGVKSAKRKQAKTKSSAQESSEIALSLHVESIALKESIQSKDRRIKDLRERCAKLEERELRLEGRQAGAVEEHELRARKAESELAVANAKVEKQGRDLRELNKMLKAWEAMRICKDSQINALLDKCKLYEDQVAEKSRALGALREKIAARAARQQPKATQAREGAALGDRSLNVAPRRANTPGKRAAGELGGEKENTLSASG